MVGCFREKIRECRHSIGHVSFTQDRDNKEELESRSVRTAFPFFTCTKHRSTEGKISRIKTFSKCDFKFPTVYIDTTSSKRWSLIPPLC